MKLGVKLREKQLAIQLEEAKLLWESGNRRIAQALIEYLLEEATARDRSSWLALQGQWLAETRTQRSEIILNSYFLRAVVESNKQKLDSNEQSQIYFRLAQFLHTLYTSLQDQKESPENVAKQKMNELTEQQLKMQEKELKSKSKTSQQQRDLHRQVTVLRNYVNGDQAASNKIEKDLADYSLQAVEAYLKCMVSVSSQQPLSLAVHC